MSLEPETYAFPDGAPVLLVATCEHGGTCNQPAQLDVASCKLEFCRACTRMPPGWHYERVCPDGHREVWHGVPVAVEPYRRGTVKVGRNKPCPCGSGRKYKKCHGAAR